MAQGKSVINTFTDGMTQDSDVLQTPASAYRDSMNGRLIYNKDGTYSWETENGSKIAIALQPRNGTDPATYYVIGNTGNDNIVVLFLVREDEGAGEIGLLSTDEFGNANYKTLFNDQDDPNGDSLNFLIKNQIAARFVYENDKCIRAYWVDGVADDSNRPRTITFQYDPNIGNPSDVNAYSGSNLSVFAFNSQTDFNMGMIKYVKNVGGGLRSGVYQYTYRLKTSAGYRTPWYPVTRRVIVTADQVSNTNWNEYEMDGSNQPTNKGNRVQVKGIDTRYDEIEVAYVFSTTSSSIIEAKIFAKVGIDGNDVLEFDNTGNIGEPLLIEEIPALFVGITGAKTLDIKDATLYYGNIKEGALPDFDIEPILQNLVMEPIIKDMRSDEWAYTGQNLPSPLPLTHGYPRTGITQLRNHNSAGGTEDYVIDNDYLNYKGTQVDHLYPGYFRGETYRFAIVFYDKLGFESFAYHLGDFKFPNQTETAYSWDRVKEDGAIVSGGGNLPERAWPTNNYNHTSLRSEKVFVGDNGGNLAPMNSVNPSLTNDPERSVSHLRIMGLKVSGIDVSSISSQISGFKIVRVERDAQILAQGMILPTVLSTEIERGTLIQPLPAYHQDFFNFGPPPLGGFPNLSNWEYNGQFQENKDGAKYKLNGYGSVLYCPAVDFGSISWPTYNSQDEIRLIGGAWDEYPGNASPSITGRGAGEQMKYIKQYYSKNNFHLEGFSGNPWPRYGSKMETVDKTNILGFDGLVEDWDGNNDLRQEVRTEDIANDERRGMGKPNSIYVRHGNFIDPVSGPAATGFAFTPFYRRDTTDGTLRALNDAGVSNSVSPMNGSFIFNYIRPNANPYGGLSPTSLEQSIFYGTGHFQPINNPLFDAQGLPGNLQFDGIEVYGGDCFLDYFSFMRIYPYSQWDSGSDQDDDYSDGRVFPYEYEFNHALREAGGEGGSTVSLQWANVGARTWRELTGASPSDYPNGVYYGGYTDGELVAVQEEFNLNDVLRFEELLIFYSPKPTDFKDNTRYPVRWRYTREKVYGDPVDNWRVFQANDFRDLNGEHGEITGSLYIFNQIYSWQISAFGRLRASDRALIESAQGGTLTTGIGDKLDGVDYNSVEIGCQHQWSLFKSDSAAYWVDTNKRKLYRFAQDGKNPLSDLKGLHQFLEAELPMFEDVDNPVGNKGIHGVYDYGNNAAIFTFNRDRVIYPDGNGNITLLSRSNLGKTYSPYIVEENHTAQISPAVWNQPVFLPNGNVGIGINENMIMYLFIEPSNLFTADIYNVDNAGINLLFTADPGKFYRLFRHSKNEPWQYQEVEANETTPYKASVSFNEVGNYFDTFHSFSPNHFIENKFLVLSNYSINDYVNGNEIFAHDLGLTGDWPSFSKKSYLKVSMNDAPMVSKVMDSMRLNCNEDFSEHLSKFLMRTETQFRFLDIQTDTRKKYQEDILRFPLRTQSQKDRMRGKSIQMTMELNNNFNHKDRITNLVTYYRPSNRL